MYVRIISDATKQGTRVETADGQPIKGLTGITFRADINDINRAELHILCVGIDAKADAKVYIGQREVRRIEYADGTVDDFPAI